MDHGDTQAEPGDLVVRTGAEGSLAAEAYACPDLCPADRGYHPGVALERLQALEDHRRWCPHIYDEEAEASPAAELLPPHRQPAPKLPQLRLRQLREFPPPRCMRSRALRSVGGLQALQAYDQRASLRRRHRTSGASACGEAVCNPAHQGGRRSCGSQQRHRQHPGSPSHPRLLGPRTPLLHIGRERGLWCDHLRRAGGLAPAFGDGPGKERLEPHSWWLHGP
mmetsp:Transcript_90381/g.286378  ORF Transcript_90381/g.286378 Transcript_90381/m.286378 type:complete len:223 (-) Transcript_90381:244-912(-)